MPRPRLVALTSILFTCAGFGCKGDAPEPATDTAAPIEVQPTDSLECGFGVTPEKGPWDEITLQADGAIKWTHVGPSETGRPDENCAKSATLDAATTKACMQGVAAIGVTERQRYILRVRTLARAAAQSYVGSRAKLGFPLADEDLAAAALARLAEEDHA